MAGPECVVEASCAIYPSEVPSKVAQAIHNVVPAEPEITDTALVARSRDGAALDVIREAIRSGRHRSAYRRVLERNMDGDTTWFLLNKQAAFAGRVAVCRDADESPLGPITITLSSPDIWGVIVWLVE